VTALHKSLLWAGIAVVVAAELGVAGLMLRPRADVAYRAYYIERSSDCWPHETAAEYALGSSLSFVQGQGNDFAPNKICGWFYPNAHGTWSYGRYSLLRFNFPPTDGPLLLTLSAGAMVNAAEPVQHVAVSANGTALATLAFDKTEAATRTVALPAGLAATGQIELRFDYPDARPGNEMGPNEDPHLRAIRMASLRLAAGGT
jgi:hypothetical protein